MEKRCMNMLHIHVYNSCLPKLTLNSTRFNNQTIIAQLQNNYSYFPLGTPNPEIDSQLQNTMTLQNDSYPYGLCTSLCHPGRAELHSEVVSILFHQQLQAWLLEYGAQSPKQWMGRTHVVQCSLVFRSLWRVTA